MRREKQPAVADELGLLMTIKSLINISGWTSVVQKCLKSVHIYWKTAPCKRCILQRMTKTKWKEPTTAHIRISRKNIKVYHISHLSLCCSHCTLTTYSDSRWEKRSAPCCSLFSLSRIAIARALISHQTHTHFSYCALCVWCRVQTFMIDIAGNKQNRMTALGSTIAGTVCITANSLHQIDLFKFVQRAITYV